MISLYRSFLFSLSQLPASPSSSLDRKRRKREKIDSPRNSRETADARKSTFAVRASLDFQPFNFPVTKRKISRIA